MYCYTKDEKGTLAANYLMQLLVNRSTDPTGNTLRTQLTSVDEHLTELAKSSGATTARRLEQKEAHSIADRLRAMDDDDHMDKEVDEALQRGFLRGINGRRLDEEEVLDQLEEQREGDEAREEQKWFKRATELIFEQEDWDALIKNFSQTSVHEKSFPTIQSCDNAFIQAKWNATVGNLRHLADLEEVCNFFHGETGTFFVLCIGFLCGIACHVLYYWFFMRNNQTRLRIAEPMKFWIIIFDLLLISFTSSAALLFNNTHKSFFGFGKVGVNGYQMHFVSAMAIILYPFAFVVGIILLVWWLKMHRLVVWNALWKQYSDPVCLELRVPVDSKFFYWIPIVKGIFMCHVRSAIPVLDSEGHEINYNEEGGGGRQAKEAKAKSMKESTKMLGELQTYQKEAEAKKEAFMAKSRVQRERELGMQEKEDREMVEKRKQVVKNVQGSIKDTWNKVATSTESVQNKAAEMGEVVQEVFSQGTSKLKILTGFSTEKTEADKKEARNQRKQHQDWKKNALQDALKTWVPEEHQSQTLGAALMERTRSQKNRQEDERLDGDEVYALKVWISNKVKDLQRLERYNVMKVQVQNNILVPDEMDGQYDFKSNSDIPHTQKENFFQNEKGERLVYVGHDRSQNAALLGRWLPGGVAGGYLQWKREPDEGWDQWIQDNKATNPMEKGDGASGSVRFANKWQYLWFDYWKQPWHEDEKDDTIAFKGKWYEFDKQNIPLYKEARDYLQSSSKGRVGYVIDANLQKEMKKFVWNELREGMLLKLTVVELAQMHELFADDVITRDEAVLCSFQDVLKSIEKAKPDPSKFTRKEKQNDFSGELLEYTLMKLEDTYDFGERSEEWWKALNQRGETDETVMLDDHLFFKGTWDQALQERRKVAHLVPRCGYSASPCFQDYPEAKFGSKSYTITKSDGSTANINVSLLFKHVAPLMRYTSAFKFNVPRTFMEMRYLSDMEIVLGQARLGEEFNYAVDRLTTLVAILVLFANTPGRLCVIVFLILRLVSYLLQVYSSAGADMQEEMDAEVEGNEVEDAANTAGDAKDPLIEGAPKRKKKRRFIQPKIANFYTGNAAVLGLQVCILLVLCAAEFELSNAAIMALVAMLLIIFAMIVMNISSFQDTVEELLAAIESAKQAFLQAKAFFTAKGKHILNGANPLKWQIYPFTVDEYFVDAVKDVGFCVPELGMNLHGQLLINEELPTQDQQAEEVYKKTIYWVTKRGTPSIIHGSGHKTNAEQKDLVWYKSVREHDRYLKDIMKKLHIVISPEQLMLRTEIPSIVATIQCVNHPRAGETCQPQFDSFLTLYKDHSDGGLFSKEATKKSEDALLAKWQEQVKEWMDKALGAVDNAQSCTKPIQQDIAGLLRAKLQSSAKTRDMYKVKTFTLRVETGGSVRCKTLEGRLARVAVLHEGESVMSVIHPSRYSPFATLEGADEAFLARADTNLSRGNTGISNSSNNKDAGPKYLEIKVPEFAVPVPKGTNKLRFLLWVRTEPSAKGCCGGGSKHKGQVYEELVSFTEELDMGFLAPATYAPAVLEEANAIKQEEEEYRTQGGQEDHHQLLPPNPVLKEALVGAGKFPTLDDVEMELRVSLKDEPSSVIMAMLSRDLDSLFPVWSLDTKAAKCAALMARYRYVKRECDYPMHCKWNTDMGTMSVHPKEPAPDAKKFAFPCSKTQTGEIVADDAPEKENTDASRASNVEEKPELLTVMRVLLTKYNAAEEKEEKELADVVEDVLAGESNMTHKKLMRHKDRWLSLARYFGIPHGDEVMNIMKDWKVTLDGVFKEFEAKNKFGGNQEDAKKWFVEEKKVRRGMATEKPYKKSFDRLCNQITEGEKVLAEEKERYKRSSSMATPARHADVVYIEEKIIHKSQHKHEHGDHKHTSHGNEKPSDDEISLTGEVREFLQQLTDLLQDSYKLQRTAAKEVLHYVFVSDQIKPSKKWRPDPIALHPAAIVTQEFEYVVDNLLVSRATVDGSDLKFSKILDGRAPALVNGRQLFRANYTRLKGTYAEPKDMVAASTVRRLDAFKSKVEEKSRPKQALYLYWDGDKRWVISTQSGKKVRWALAPEEECVYVQDTARSPEAITGRWLTWTGDMQGGWNEDMEIQLLGPRDGKGDFGPGIEDDEENQLFDDEEEEAKKGCCAKCTGTIASTAKEVGSLLKSGDDTNLTPSLKEVLVGMVAGNIVFSWKDQDIEDLAPFRKFMLTKLFGSYEWQWFYFTRDQQFPVDQAEQNLERIFREVKKEGIVSDAPTDETNEEAEANRMALESKVTGLPAETHASTAQAPQGGTGLLETQASGSRLQPSSSRLRQQTMARKDENNTALQARKFLMSMESEGGFSQLAHKIVSALDRDGSKFISNLEIERIFKKNDDAGEQIKQALKRLQTFTPQAQEDQDELLDAFTAWCMLHPRYKDVATLWAEMSRGMTLTRANFQQQMQPYIYDFVSKSNYLYSLDMMKDDPRKPFGDTVLENVCEEIFHRLDTTGKDEITYIDLIPKKGPRREDCDNPLLKFQIPLAQLQQFYVGKRIYVDDQKYYTFSMQVSPDFVGDPEWSGLMKVLDKNWDPKDGSGTTLKFALSPYYYKLWRHVIEESGMLAKQEWIRFYEGDFMDHGHLDVYMRKGNGMQQWGDGQVYSGGWESHVYHGEGKLWQKQTHMAMSLESGDAYRGPPPIFTGSWKWGKRNGRGTFYFGGSSEKGGAYNKMYLGNFEDDLFNGEGELTFRLQYLRTNNTDTEAATELPAFELRPQQLLSFVGVFETRWMQAKERVCGSNNKRAELPYYAALHKDERINLDLHKIVPSKNDKLSPEEQKMVDKYFPKDAPKGKDAKNLLAHAAQLSGVKLPDLCSAYYSLKGADASSCKRGRAEYLDGTIYVGDFKYGKPHGYGKLEQWKFGTYDGEWQNGKFHGKGRLELNEAHRKTLEFSTYDGDWKNGLFDGEGKIVFGVEDEYLYIGKFEKQHRVGHGQLWHGPAGEQKLQYSGPWRKGLRGDEIAAFTPALTQRTQATMNTMCWMPLEKEKEEGKDGPADLEYYYFGHLSPLGSAEGEGTLFSAAAKEDADFMQAVKDGTAWKEVVAGKMLEGRVDKDTPYMLYYPTEAQLGAFKYILYSGCWKNNRPDGFGMQYFAPSADGKSKGGMYIGEFKDGKRYGQGLWEVPAGLSKRKNWQEGEWLYRPARASKNPNWENDLMHGIGIVEDIGHVHENVVYNYGDCMMPFTDKGPPQTSAQFKKAKLGQKAKPATGKDTGVDNKDNLQKLARTFGQRRYDEREVGATEGLADIHLTMKTQDAVENVDEYVEIMAREPTEQEMFYEEDVFVTGGTGVNEIMNGMYYRLSCTPGYTVFKMTKIIQEQPTKPQRGAPKEVPPTFLDRYLYYDASGKRWVLATRLLRGLEAKPGCATAKEAPILVGVPNRSPTSDRNIWMVWSQKHQKLRQPLKVGELPTGSGGLPDNETASTKKSGWLPFLGSSEDYEEVGDVVDRIEVFAIAGVMLLDYANKLKSTMFLRHKALMFGRPVYEADYGGKYLYWVPHDEDLEKFEAITKGKSTEVKTSLMSELIGDGEHLEGKRLEVGLCLVEFTGSSGQEIADAKLLYLGEKKGYWIIANKLGDYPSQANSACDAWVEDNAATPDLILADGKWQINKGPRGGTEESTAVKVELLDTKFEKFSALAGRPPAGTPALTDGRR